MRNQPVVRQPTAYKSARYQCPQQRFASQVDVSNKLTKCVTPHFWDQMKESSFAKPNDLIAPGPSRNCPKHVSLKSPREKVGSNDMVHNYYLEKAKKSAQLQKDKDVNGKPSMITPARLPNTANVCKPKPRNWKASMTSLVSNKDVHLGNHRKQKPFLKLNDLQCPTCKKCLYSANHDECILEYLSKLNPRASTQNKDAKSHKTTKRYMPVEKSRCPKHVSLKSPREKVGSNDMVHNYYIEKAKKSAQLQKDKDVNGKPSMITPARLPNTANVCKPKPRNWKASMTSQVSNKDVHLREHRKQKPFLKFNDLQCPTCKKCLYSANHDEFVLEYLSKLNPSASAQNKDAKSHKTTKRYMPVEKISKSKRPERQIPLGHRCSKKKATTVPEKTMTPRPCLRWQPTGRIPLTFWPRSSTTKMFKQSSSSLGLHCTMTSVHISSGLVLHQMTSDHNCSELGSQDHSNEQSSSKLVPKVVGRVLDGTTCSKHKPPAPEAGVEPNIVAQWTALYDAHTEIACLMLGNLLEALYDAHTEIAYLMLGSMIPELHRQFELMRENQLAHMSLDEELCGTGCLGYVLHKSLSVGLILNDLTTISITWGRQLVITCLSLDGKIQKDNKKSLNAKGKNKVKGKGNDKKVYIPQPKNPKPTAMERPFRMIACNHGKEVGSLYVELFLLYLAELIKKKKVKLACQFFQCFINKLFSFLLNPGCMTLVVVLIFVTQNMVLEE
ncbi:hypothetical protein Tco_0413926 [Tanacetum coccineum]